VKVPVASPPKAIIPLSIHQAPISKKLTPSVAKSPPGASVNTLKGIGALTTKKPALLQWEFKNTGNVGGAVTGPPLSSLKMPQLGYSYTGFKALDLPIQMDAIKLQPALQKGNSDFGLSRVGDAPVLLVEVPGPQAAVPEPSTWAMMLLGFWTVGIALRRRRRTPTGHPQITGSVPSEAA